MPPRRSATLAICLAAAFTTLLDRSSLNTAIPALRSALDAGPATLQWISAGYSPTFGVALVPAAHRGDAQGRRLLFAGGVALFTTAAGLAAGFVQVSQRISTTIATAAVGARPGILPGLPGGGRPGPISCKACSTTCRTRTSARCATPPPTTS